MSVSEWLEVGKIFGSIVLVWFGLVGWRLLPLLRRTPDPCVGRPSTGSPLQTATRTVRDASGGEPIPDQASAPTPRRVVCSAIVAAPGTATANGQ